MTSFKAPNGRGGSTIGVARAANAERATGAKLESYRLDDAHKSTGVERWLPSLVWWLGTKGASDVAAAGGQDAHGTSEESTHSDDESATSRPHPEHEDGGQTTRSPWHAVKFNGGADAGVYREQQRYVSAHLGQTDKVDVTGSNETSSNASSPHSGMHDQDIAWFHDGPGFGNPAQDHVGLQEIEQLVAISSSDASSASATAGIPSATIAYTSAAVSGTTVAATASDVVPDPRAEIDAWSAYWRSAVAEMEANSAGGLEEEQAVLNNTVGLGLLSDAPGTAPAVQFSALAANNPIVLENQKAGTPQSVWGIDGAGSANIEGFATNISVDNGTTVSFKINTSSTHYKIDIYRLGYYGGDGAHLVTSIDKTLASAQVQPIPLYDAARKMTDAGNWNVSATWDVPADAVSGVYFAKMTRLDGTFGENIIPFIVRDDENPSDITFQTADTTWQAYNWWGGSNVYSTIDQALNDSRGYAVSYNRPIITRGGGAASGPQDFIFGVEYPTIRWLEQNGYNVNYISGVDTDRSGAQLLNSKVFLSTGHDEYWSIQQRANVEAARDAGVNLGFLGGNDVYWTTRWENSLDASGTPYRTLVVYKEIRSNTNVDPNGTTSTWRDPLYGPGLPENALIGTMFTVDSYRQDTLTIPYAMSNFRFWNNTAVANLQPGQVYSLTPNLLGYEWNSDVDNGFRPDGLINLSSTTLQVEQKLLDYGTRTGTATETHALTLYRADSGALVFSAGTVYWSWGLDDNHDLEVTPVDPNVQQAMVNLFAEMGVQPDTLVASLLLASKSTDTIAPTSTISAPGNGATLPAYSPITITGTATDTGGGLVAVVEVSTDGGATWHRATGYNNWSYTWTPVTGGPTTIKTRAVDDSVNIETPGAGRTITIDQPRTRTLFTGNEIPAVISDNDQQEVNLGVKFTASQAGTIVGVKFYKGLQDTDDHVGSLWTTTGTQLATVTFTNETTSGWQTAIFSSPVSIAANTSYVVSYHSNAHYASTSGFFANGYANGALSVAANGGAGNSYYSYGETAAFPNLSAGGANYWVDALFVPASNAANLVPVAVSDAGYTQRNVALSLAGSQLISNDSDSDGDVVFITGVTGAVNGTAAFNAQTNTVTFTPNQNYQGAASFNYTLSDGLATTSGAVNITVAPPFTATNLFTPAQTPAVLSDPDQAQVNLGVKFLASETGSIVGIKYYRGTGDAGAHTGSLWTAAGQLLATATFAAETASGWQSVNFSAPVTISAGATYVASYHSNGHYAATGNFFGSTYTNGSLSTPGPSAGVYAYGAGELFPTSTSAANYWVDVMFVSTGAPIARNDTGFTTQQGSPTQIAGATLLANDTDPNNDVLTILGVTPGAGGTPFWNAQTGSVSFTPSPGYVGAANFNYQITDGNNDPVSANVALTVLPGPSSKQLFAFTDTPAILNDPDPAGVNLGVKFVAAEAGTITGLKYYKGVGDTGTHVGSLWSSNGTLLASATYTNESASGWQYVSFAAPVAITAGATYVASYHSNGHYTATGNFFGSTYTNGPLSTPGAGAGVYAYAAGDLFPTSTSNANYWVDVLFTPSGAPIAVKDTGFTTAQGAPLAIGAASLLANDTDPTNDILSILGVAPGVGGTPAFIAQTNTVTFTPTPGFVGNASFSYQNTDGPNASVPAVVELTVLPSAATAQLFPFASTPATLSDPDSTDVNLGVKFDSTQAGTITGLKFYKGTGDTGTHVGYLWSSTGTVLASATFANETAGGWQYVTFTNPVAISAGATYVAGFTSSGNFASTGNFFATEYTNGILSTSGPAAGVFSYGAAGLFPVSTSNANYWIDVLMEPAGGGNAAPVVTSPSTASFAENATGNVLTLTATDANADPLTFTLAGADAARFSIASAGAGSATLSFLASPDFEAPTDADLNNTYALDVQVSDGTVTTVQALTVTVTNVAGTTYASTVGTDVFAGTPEADTFNFLTTGAPADSFNGAGGVDALIIAVAADTTAQTLTAAYDGVGLTSFSLSGNSVDVSNIESIAANLGGGTDTLAYTSSSAVSVNLATGTASGFASISAIENVTGGTGNDNLTGDGNANAFDGGVGADTMIGGAGDDSYVVDVVGDIVTEAAAGGTDTVTSAISYTLSAEVERLVLTGAAALNGTGNGLANTLTGNGLANLLDGGLGADTMIGGSGDDSYIVDIVGDVVTEVVGGGADTVNSSVTYTLSAEVENLVLTGTAAINGAGNGLANSLTGNSGVNLLDGGAGADTMIGGAGNDTYVVDVIGDVVTEAAGQGTDTVNSSIAYTLGAELENLTLTGAAAINGTGNTLSNVMIGNAAVNTLNGGAGGDTITGGGGADTINTGAANDNLVDALVFTASTDYGDIVTSFDASGTAAQIDKVQFSGALNTAFDDITNNDQFAFVFGNGNTFTGVAANIATTAEALYLGGVGAEGVTNANLTNAAAVAAAFNAEFAITGAGDALLVINDTNANSFSVWAYAETGTAEIQAAELALIGRFTANTTVQSASFGFI